MEDPVSLQEVEDTKDRLEQYFHACYCAPPLRPVTPPPSFAPPSLTFDSPKKVNFTSHYKTLPIESVDGWEEFQDL